MRVAVLGRCLYYAGRDHGARLLNRRAFLAGGVRLFLASKDAVPAGGPPIHP
jgi:hypothetical protein